MVAGKRDRREDRIRQAAQKIGIRLVKSRSRDPESSEFGRYGLIHTGLQLIVNAPPGSGSLHNWTLDEVEDYLRIHSPKRRPGRPPAAGKNQEAGQA